MILKVSSKTEVGKLAGSIAQAIRQDLKVEIQCVGAGAINQAIKASIVANGMLSQQGISTLLKPYFNDILIDGERRTAIVFEVIVW